MFPEGGQRTSMKSCNTGTDEDRISDPESRKLLQTQTAALSLPFVDLHMTEGNNSEAKANAKTLRRR